VTPSSFFGGEVGGVEEKLPELMRALSELRDLYEELHQIIHILEFHQNKILITFSSVISSTLWTRDLNIEKETERVRNLVVEISREVIAEVGRRLRKYCHS
jgi:hypothetical protein